MLKCEVSPPERCQFLAQVQKAVDGIGTQETYLGTKLPFPFVCFMWLVVQVNNYIQCWIAGITCAKALLINDWWMLGISVAYVVFVPVLYDTLLIVTVELDDPMNGEPNDFHIEEDFCSPCESLADYTEHLFKPRDRPEFQPTAMPRAQTETLNFYVGAHVVDPDVTDGNTSGQLSSTAPGFQLDGCQGTRVSL